MSDIAKALASAREALSIESSALANLAQSIETNIAPALEILIAAQGRVVISGLGKSGLVGAKIAATLASTGTPSIYIHSADALHGDSGAVAPGDVVVVISNSGETVEVVKLAEMVRSWGNKVIAITSKVDSTLGAFSDAILHIPFAKEADPNGLAPTTSTTLTIAIGDALAAALITYKNFSPKDFGIRHPGGALGKKSNG